MIKKILVVLVVVLVIIQAFRPKLENINATPNEASINNFSVIPSDVEKQLKTSCYDCHSNNTVYPWYASVQPLGWWLEHHIEEGKSELNFDEFGNYTLRRKYHKLEEIAEMLENDEMPLQSYTIIHTDAKLSPEQKAVILTWTNKAMSDMRAKYPSDSLMKK